MRNHAVLGGMGPQVLKLSISTKGDEKDGARGAEKHEYD
jgi:hypothetical protein